jgi:gliding motility-associated-like protein
MTIAMTALQIKDCDVFLNFTIEIYNRWGALIWQGDNNTSDWDGYANKGMLFR